MGFEKFEGRCGYGVPLITIRTYGQIGIPKAAAALLNVDEYKRCQLYYDRGNNLIGMIFNNDEAGGATISFTERDGYRARFINARGFFKHYAIDISICRGFMPKLDEKTGMVVLDLNNPVGDPNA